jgi:SAM-dependent methyltransferase
VESQRRAGAPEQASTDVAVATLRSLAEKYPGLRAGVCSCCGHAGPFSVEPRALRETFQCESCRASLRYRNQADALLTAYATGERSLTELANARSFASMAIYEPGVSGPFRPLLTTLPAYTTSYYWTDVEPGQARNGVRCENLEALTFPDASFDLIISSDIFEHVRRPLEAFEEIYRVLRPGGRHIFTVPMNWPFEHATVQRVDVSGADDLHLLPAVYHGSPLDPSGSLVYNDFGMDLPFKLTSLGFQVLVQHGFRNVITFIAQRPHQSE